MTTETAKFAGYQIVYGRARTGMSEPVFRDELPHVFDWTPMTPRTVGQKDINRLSANLMQMRIRALTMPRTGSLSNAIRAALYG